MGMRVTNEVISLLFWVQVYSEASTVQMMAGDTQTQSLNICVHLCRHKELETNFRSAGENELFCSFLRFSSLATLLPGVSLIG